MKKLWILFTIIVAAMALGVTPLFAQDATPDPMVIVVETPEPSADAGAYDEAWLREVADDTGAINTIAGVWMQRRNEGEWRYEGMNGTFSVPANSVVLATEMNSGNTAAFEVLAPGIYFTGQGGEFGTTGAMRAFQLDGNIESATALNLDDLLDQIAAIDDGNPATTEDHDDIIEMLDVLWSTGNNIDNRWGSSGPGETLTEAQRALMIENNMPLQPLQLVIPGNSIIWGQLDGDAAAHWGLVMITQDVYVPSCLGGNWVTLQGYRAMQLPPRAEGALISDMEGCEGKYPVLNTSNNIETVRTVLPLASQ